MLTGEQQRRELDWGKNRRTYAGDCTARGIRRSANAGAI